MDANDGRLLCRDDILGLVAFGLLSHEFLIEWDRDRLIDRRVD